MPAALLPRQSTPSTPLPLMGPVLVGTTEFLSTAQQPDFLVPRVPYGGFAGGTRLLPAVHFSIYVTSYNTVGLGMMPLISSGAGVAGYNPAQMFWQELYNGAQQTRGFQRFPEQAILGTMSVTTAQPTGPRSQFYSGGAVVLNALLPFTVQAFSVPTPREMSNTQ